MWVLGLRKGPWAPGAAVKGLAAAWTAPGAERWEDSDEAEWAQGGRQVRDGELQAPKGLARLTSRSEEGGGWVGELLASGQGPIGPWKAGQEVVPKVKLVGVALHGTGRGAVSEGPGLVLFLPFHP